MRAAASSRYRVVVDEYSLDWKGRVDVDLVGAADNLADLLEPLTTGKQVALMDHAFNVECWESVRLFELMYTRDARVPRDVRVRLAALLDKCEVVEPQDDDLPQCVVVRSNSSERSFGFCHALALASAGRAMSCLIASPEAEIGGWTKAKREADGKELDIHLLTASAQLPDFWRGVIRQEQVAEAQFFEMAESAFPNLIFASSLSFGRFKGSYGEVVPWLVDLLAGVNDRFASSLALHKGDQKKVIREFSALGLTISPESPLTHKDKRAWDMRLVSHDGQDHRCEWHGKRLWDRDRVHFSLPIEKYQGRVLIGVFVDHLE